jgi:NAD(P)-dependent dehydrogenase (short-subunit alcohol dehydrogenase family)
LTGQTSPIEELTIEDFDRPFAVNVRGPYFLAFLASDAARWITGKTINVDGGSRL